VTAIARPVTTSALLEQAQLEHSGRREPVDPQHRARRRHGGSRRHQPHELGSEHFRATHPRLHLNAIDDDVERGGFPVLDVHAHLHDPGARQFESERPDAREAASALAHGRGDLPRDVHRRAAEVHVERDQRPPRTHDHSAGALVEARRPEIRLHLAGVQPSLQLGRSAAPEEGRPSTLRELAVEEDRQREVVRDPSRYLGGAFARALHVLRDDRNDGNDVGGADPWMRAFMRAQVNPVASDADACEQRRHELVLRADKGEDRPVVILVGVDVEQPGVAAECLADRIDHRAIASFGEVRHRFENSHVRTLGAVKAYYHARAREYDDWWLGRGLYGDRERPGWEDELSDIAELIASLPPVRTLDVACGTGFLTRHLRGEVVGLDQSDAMLDVAREQVPDATFVQGDALDLPFADDAFDRVFTTYFYCHLETPERARFLAEARRVAGELVVIGSIHHEGEQPERWEERLLKDGSRWTVYKRVFDPATLAAELGDGEILHAGRWFVVVQA
jgi:SAM-dependent methyltransferase